MRGELSKLIGNVQLNNGQFPFIIVHILLFTVTVISELLYTILDESLIPIFINEPYKIANYWIFIYGVGLI